MVSGWVTPFYALAGHYDGRYFFGHNSPAARARELFKLSTDSGSLLVYFEKKIFYLGSLWMTSKWGLFAFFWPNLSGPGCQPNEPFFGSCFFGI